MARFKYTINGNEYEVSIDRFEGSQAAVTVNGITYDVEIQREKKAQVRVERPKVVAGAGPQPTRMRPEAGIGAVKSPLPGVIREVRVKAGDEVTQGQCVCILEAMKMENEIYANTAGKVTAVSVSPGQSVLEGETLLVIGG
jgi:glutaconyl-CoA/methylmalonyl-CoA decarboxylase subunit gamma